MMRIAWSIFFIFLLLGGSPAISAAKSGIPGVTVFFEQDSSYYTSVQLVQKNVLVDLYSEAAAVRTIYMLYNTTGVVQQVAVGFPAESVSDKKENLPVVYSNGQTISVRRCEKSNAGVIEDWYVWEATFLPKDTTVLEIYTFVPTAKKGQKEAKFCLLPDSSQWMKNLPYGNITVYLKEGITEKDLLDISPGYFKTKQGDWLFYEYNSTNSSILYEKVCIRYHHSGPTEVAAFSEQGIQACFEELKQARWPSLADRSSLRMPDLGHGSGTWLVPLLRYGLLLGVPLLLLGISLATAYIIVRRARGKKDTK
jgi:hypothetical protein